jgi:hypothetical protein
MKTSMTWSPAAGLIRANGRAEGKAMRLNLKEDTAVLDFRPVRLEINAGGQCKDTACAIVELRIVLRALDGVVHHKAVAQVNRFMCAEAIGREEFVDRAAVDGKGPTAMVKSDYVFGLDVVC